MAVTAIIKQGWLGVNRDTSVKVVVISLADSLAEKEKSLLKKWLPRCIWRG